MAAGSDPFSIATGALHTLNVQVSLPGDQMQVVTVQGKPMFVPIVPHEGSTKVLMGLYSNASDSRLPLTGTVHDRRSYVVGNLDLLKRTEGIFVMFKEGWHAAETPPDNASA